MKKLLFATTNNNKIDRIQKLVKHLGIELIGLDSTLDISEPDKTGSSAAENAEIKAKFYMKNLDTEYPILTQDDSIDLEGVLESENPGVSIKGPVMSEYGEFNDENAYKYYTKLAEKYGGEINIIFNYGHAIVYQERIVSGKSQLKGILTSSVSKKRTPGYFLVDMLLVPVEGKLVYYNSLSDEQLIEKDIELKISVSKLIKQIFPKDNERIRN